MNRRNGNYSHISAKYMEGRERRNSQKNSLKTILSVFHKQRRKKGYLNRGMDVGCQSHF